NKLKDSKTKRRHQRISWTPTTRRLTNHAQPTPPPTPLRTHSPTPPVAPPRPTSPSTSTRCCLRRPTATPARRRRWLWRWAW
ncbi:Os07g0107366, partial [Oryza sativa Japonica Group]